MKATSNILREFILNIVYVAMSIGVPIYYIWFNYEIVATYDTVTQIRMGGLMLLLIFLFFGKGYLSGFVYSMKLSVVKKFFWGVERILPLVGIFLAIGLVIQYGVEVREVIQYTILTNLFAYVVAPVNVTHKKNITGK
jgi:hypothetical protein